MNPYDELERRAKEAASLEDAATVLAALLGGGFAVWDDGSLYSIKLLVARVNGLEIHVYSREHAPPHFHVKGANVDAVFTLQGCDMIEGTLDGRQRRLVEWWHARSYRTLVKAWNESRPSDCPVGPINDTPAV